MIRKAVIPAPRIRGGKLRRESKAYRLRTKSAINYLHLLSTLWRYEVKKNRHSRAGVNPEKLCNLSKKNRYIVYCL